MFLSSVFSWSEQGPARGRRSRAELVSDTLTLELSWQLKRAERLWRERRAECRRLRNVADYTWLNALPRRAYQLPPAEQLELQDLCSRIKPSQCGPVILRFRKLVCEFDPEVHEVPRLFRSALLDFIEEEEEQSGPQVLRQQLESRWEHSLSLITMRSRLRINPFCQDRGAETSGPGLITARRARSMPEFDLREDD
ncbi:protein RD3-like [Pristis pectinata]|uniref:protein RD3-like n=1 Tax=Pristis pectinata TaxID=685728 RepID=UPI00223E2015|nr:protein RD3-like [Pristis pectinata]